MAAFPQQKYCPHEPQKHLRCILSSKIGKCRSCFQLSVFSHWQCIEGSRPIYAHLKLWSEHLTEEAWKDYEHI